jgi:Erythromycin esterase
MQRVDEEDAASAANVTAPAWSHDRDPTSVPTRHRQGVVRRRRAPSDDLVAEIVATEHDEPTALAVHAAEHIDALDEHFAMSDPGALVFRDRHAADDLRCRADLTGDRITHWAVTPHTANARHPRIDVPPDPAMRFASTGSYLHPWCGRRDVSIGFTFDHGTASLGGDQVAALPPPPSKWFEHPLGAVPCDQYDIDLRRAAPDAAVRRWLRRPMLTRGLPGRGPDSTIRGGPLAATFDLIVHRHQVTSAPRCSPASPLASARAGRVPSPVGRRQAGPRHQRPRGRRHLARSASNDPPRPRRPNWVAHRRRHLRRRRADVPPLTAHYVRVRRRIEPSPLQPT